MSVSRSKKDPVLDDSQPLAPAMTMVLNDTFRRRLETDIDNQIVRRSSLVIHFTWAGTTLPKLKPAVVIFCGDAGDKGVIQSHCSKLPWLRDLRDHHGFDLHVILDPITLSAKTGTSSLYNIQTIMECTLILPLEASTVCGSCVNITHAGQGRPHISTFGGFIVAGDLVYGILAKHPFIRAGRYPEVNAKDNEYHTDELPFKITSDDSGAVNETSPSGESSSSANDSENSSDRETRQRKVPQRNGQGNYLSLKLDMIVPESAPAGDGASASDPDVAFASLANLPRDLIHRILLPNRTSTDIIEIFMTEPQKERCRVAILANDFEHEWGYLSPHLVPLHLKASVYNVRLVITDSPLSMGCSGAWVISGNKFCGFIVAIHQRRNWAYMMPSDQLVAEAKRCFKTDDVRLPTISEMASMRSRKSFSLAARGQVTDFLKTEDGPAPSLSEIPENQHNEVQMQDSEGSFEVSTSSLEFRPTRAQPDSAEPEAKGGASSFVKANTETKILPVRQTQAIAPKVTNNTPSANVLFPGFSPPAPTSTFDMTGNIVVSMSDVLSFLGAHGFDIVRDAWDREHPTRLIVENYQIAVVDALPEFFTAVVNNLASHFVKSTHNAYLQRSKGQEGFALSSGESPLAKEKSEDKELSSMIGRFPSSEDTAGQSHELQGKKGLKKGKVHRSFTLITDDRATETFDKSSIDRKRSSLADAEQRKKVKRVRLLGACLRCWLTDEACDDSEECIRCRLRTRKWKLGCVRIWLDGRLSSLQPDVLGENKTFSGFNTFKDLNSYQLDFARRPSFLLRVGWVIGPGVYLMVNEVAPLGSKLLEQDAFNVLSLTNDHAEVESLELASPPLLPDVTSDHRYGSGRIQDQIMEWVQAVLHKSNYDFIWHCFWDVESEKWERETLIIIWEYHRRDLEEHQALTDAFKLLAINHVLTRAVTVSDEDIPKLYQHLQHSEYHNKDERPKIVSPRAIDMLIKSLTYPAARTLAQESLSNLQNLLLDRSNSVVSKDLGFCVSFLLMMVLGRNQNAVLDLARILWKRKESGLTLEAAKSLVGKMDEDIADHIIGLYQYRSSLSSKKPGNSSSPESDAEKHSAEFKMFERLEENFTELGMDFAPSATELPHDVQEIDENFYATNLKRLLFKFYISAVHQNSS